MPKCTYCGKTYEFPKGLTYVTREGSVYHFCSSKCKKNMFMKRRRVNWIRKSSETKKPSEAKASKKSLEKN